MAYPTLPFSPGSKITLLDDLKFERATNGAGRARAFYTGQKRRFEIVHAYLTPTQKNDLRAFYDANRYSTFTLDWEEDDGSPQTSTVMFGGPIKWDCKAGVWWFANVLCEEV